MPKIIVQIYEVQTPGEAEVMISLGVDHIGSVLLSGVDWKAPDLRETLGVVRASGAKSSLIPLFRGLDEVLRATDYYQPDILHFCEAFPLGDDRRKFCDRLIELQNRVKERFPETAIMRSIPIAPPGSTGQVPTLEFARWFMPATDLFLIDTQRVGGHPGVIDGQPVPGFVGITGTPCDWAVAHQLVTLSPIPVILAGGISPENVQDAIAAARPAGVDSCTLTNAVDAAGMPIRFRKDPGKVRDLVAAVRRAENKK